jgi:tRNA-Thr(GGU) m(6)t(6)A37 methyltransferase TsaA
MMKRALVLLVWLLAGASLADTDTSITAAKRAASAMANPPPTYQVQPVGWIRKQNGRTLIEIDDQYRPALLGVDALDSLWVLYWFDRNDTPEQRAILQVHPRGNPDNPLRGVFATRAPMRPNLIAMSRVRVLGVEGIRIEIDGIDAFDNTPVLDLKPDNTPVLDLKP